MAKYTKETNYYSNYIIIKTHENAKQTAVTTNGEFPAVTITFHPSSSTLWCRLRLAVPSDDDEGLQLCFDFLPASLLLAHISHSFTVFAMSASNARHVPGFRLTASV